MNGRAIDELYRRYGPAVLRRARAILRDEQGARDVLQEVFIRAIEEGGSFRGESSPMTWMYRITTNLCLNRIRDEGRRARLLDEHVARDEEARPATADERLTLARILRRVPDGLREIAVYYYVDQMSHDEIAALVKTSRRTVGNRLEEFRRLALAAAEPVAEVV
ncbi:RNA polymerase sigma factor [Vulgatibacter incomptus]|uniref:RNA polymerase sigma-54 factor RpoN n=1 Tax=Vulgatibacter incomptus TaxID=1391653 RepID=A0A0K1PCB6_9BACT|nr:sigma-70 family RNA polymerase sigma factor [Vulgatibacter incomptus]AKU91152.1 RNA polymerase sigma-54 factor RpoN [Vulgatibacter incomptus]